MVEVDVKFGSLIVDSNEITPQSEIRILCTYLLGNNST